MLVVDTNLLVYHYLSPGHAATLAALLRHDRDWVAPRLWRSELRNVLATYLRQELLVLQDALAIMNDAEQFVGTRDFEPPSGLVLALAQSSRCSAYDCEFVALAQDLGVPLITFDSTLLQRFPAVAIAPDEYLARLPRD